MYNTLPYANESTEHGFAEITYQRPVRFAGNDVVGAGAGAGPSSSLPAEQGTDFFYEREKKAKKIFPLSKILYFSQKIAKKKNHKSAENQL